MATFSLIPLSVSADFRGIKIAATASPGTAIHTAQASASLGDFLTIDITNVDTVPRPYTIEWGGTTSPDDQKRGVILPGQTVTVARKRGIRNALSVRVASITMTWIDGLSYTGATNILIVHGQVQRQLT